MKQQLMWIGVIAAWGTSANAQNWTPGPPMISPRGGHGAAVDQCGNIYVVGGQVAWCSSELTNTVEMLAFDGLAYSKEWVQMAPMSIARDELALVCIGDFLYAIGGQSDGDKGGFLASVERYDTTTDTWSTTAVPDLNVARIGAGAVADGQGRIYVIGGVGLDEKQNPTALDSVEVFDLARPELGWTLRYSLNVSRRSAGVAIDGLGRIYTIGGSDLNEHLRTVERFDPCTPNTGWVILDELIPGRPASNEDRAVTGADGRIYVAGGWLPGYSNRVVRFDPNSETWQEWAMLETERTELALVLGKDGRIRAIGGATFGCPDAMDTVETLTAPCGADQARPLLMDFNGDGVINTSDLLELFAHWGSCIF